MTNKPIFKTWVCFEISNGCGPKKNLKIFFHEKLGVACGIELSIY